MWIMTNRSFISVVEPTPGTPAARADQLVCRARIAGHLQAVFGDFAGKVEVGTGTDYRFRCLVKREIVAKVIADQVRSINYGNFKNSVRNAPYHDALMGVWTIMHRLQERFAPKPKGRQRPLPFHDRAAGHGYGPGRNMRQTDLDDDLDWLPPEQHRY
jgi:hypothetical protein